MGSRDPRVDAYIAVAPAFAQPILTRLRTLVHAGCSGVTETIKWGMPFFEHKGVLCSMAAFKSHCAFGFWHSAMRDAVPGATSDAMGQFGRIARLSDLPGDAALKALVRQAAAINASGVKSARPRNNGGAPPEVPDDRQK